MSTPPPSVAPLPAGVSRTAIMVAQARADEHRRADRLFTDPLAGPLVEAAGRITGVSEAGRMAGGHFVLRTRFFDDYLTEAAGDGCRQVVLLGAGLDSRAFRLDWPAGLRLFELDLPDLLSFKQNVIADREAACARVIVPVDLRDDWPGELLAAGFDPDRPTAWLVEGVIMYLPPDAGEMLMERVGKLSAPRSRLGLEHANRAYMEVPQLQAARQRLASTGAGWQSSVEDPVEWLDRHGWDGAVTSQKDLAERHDRPVPGISDPSKVGDARLWLLNATRKG